MNLVNQKRPTYPITEDLDVGWRLALASNSTGLVNSHFILARFIRVEAEFVKLFDEIAGIFSGMIKEGLPWRQVPCAAAPVFQLI